MNITRKSGFRHAVVEHRFLKLEHSFCDKINIGQFLSDCLSWLYLGCNSRYDPRRSLCYIFGTVFQYLSSPLLCQESVKAIREIVFANCLKIRRQNRRQRKNVVPKTCEGETVIPGMVISAYEMWGLSVSKW